MKKDVMQGILRRLYKYQSPLIAFAIVFLGISVFFQFSKTVKADNFSDPIEVEETEVSYLTEDDFESLYSCRPEITVTNDRIVELDYEDAQLLMHIARAEAGESLDGQLWTMRTIINRIEDERFPNNIHDITHVKGQFEVVTSGRYKTVKLNENSHLALSLIEQGWDETEGAVWFESSSNSPNSWHAKNLDFIKEVEGQRYYR